jgi:hypothetical protein
MRGDRTDPLAAYGGGILDAEGRMPRSGSRAVRLQATAVRSPRPFLPCVEAITNAGHVIDTTNGFARASCAKLRMPHGLAGWMLAGVRDHRLRCAVCGDVIGFYEPVVVLDDSGLRETSLLNEPMLVAEQVAMHQDCAPGSKSASPERCNPAARVAPLAAQIAKGENAPSLRDSS